MRTPYHLKKTSNSKMKPWRKSPNRLTMQCMRWSVMDKWLAYAPVKNNLEDASKVPKGNPYHSATSGEMAIYKANCLILRKVTYCLAVVLPRHGSTASLDSTTTWHSLENCVYVVLSSSLGGATT
ncbi:hypothetical protein GW17_00008077 [Ensete ventricosum]|nr:hypothetical protein GW17_00008077 [Ensete ventricosum]